MTRRLLLTGLCAVAGLGCEDGAEDRADELCREADRLERVDPRQALEARRRIWEEMPTAGTANARKCLRAVRERMGAVRVLVAEDEDGDPRTIEGCAWAAQALTTFGESPSPPFRIHWAERLMERCRTVVGRAWSRSPDDARLIDLDRSLSDLIASSGTEE